MMYNAVVQAVLIYDSKRWVVTDTMITMLERFHHRIAIRIAVRTARKVDGGEWEWELVEMALEITGVFPVRDYMRRR